MQSSSAQDVLALLTELRPGNDEKTKTEITIPTLTKEFEYSL